MNIIQKSLKALTSTFGDSDIKETVLANGSIIDKKDVEDPTEKFHSMKPKRIVRNYRVLNNVAFYAPEYDLPTIANAVQLDGLLQRSVNIFVEQVLKNGYEITSKNDRLLRHVNRRMKEIQQGTGVSFYETMNNIARQLVTYGNCFIIKVRSNAKSRYGSQYRLYGKNHNPIVGLFVADATTMSVGINKEGHVSNYRQNIRGRVRYWDERDVIHITYNKIPGTLTGMSSIIPVLDDVRALRKLEEEVEILGFQYSIPLYLYKVGTKDQPPASNEIESVSATVNNMPSYGMLVVPGHHDITVPTNNNTPVDILSFVNHFKRRIYSGLGVSPIAMGEVETSNRNTSEVLDASMQTITKRYQQIIKNKIELELFRELLLDGGLNPSDTYVEFNFPEIDLEQQIKKENMILQKWQNNMITRTEARLEMDYERAIQDPDTFLRLVEIPKIETEGGIQKDVAKIGAQAAKARANSSVSKAASSTNKKKRATTAANMPSNQHGTSSGRPKIKRDSIQEVYVELTNSINNLLLLDGYKSPVNKDKAASRIMEIVGPKLRRMINRKLTEIKDFHHLPVDDIDSSALDNYINDIRIILTDKVGRHISQINDDIKVGLFIDEIKDFFNIQEAKADNLVKALLYKSLGYKTILVNAEGCSRHTSTNISSNDLSYLKIPPFRYGCNCSIDEESFYEFQEI